MYRAAQYETLVTGIGTTIEAGESGVITRMRLSSCISTVLEFIVRPTESVPRNCTISTKDEKWY